MKLCNIYLGPRVGTWEPLWALSVSYKPTLTPKPYAIFLHGSFGRCPALRDKDKGRRVSQTRPRLHRGTANTPPTCLL